MKHRESSLKLNRVIQAVFGFAASIFLGETLSIADTGGREAVAYSNSFLSFLLGVLCVFCLVQAQKRLTEQSKWKKRISTAFAFVFSLALVVGKQLETVENSEITNVIMWVAVFFLTLFFTPHLQVAWQWIEERWGWENREEPVEKRTEKAALDTDMQRELPFFRTGAFWRNLILIFICWLPVFLAFYPGAFVYDATDEYVQVATRSFTTHHPLIHVLLLGGLVTGGNKFFGSFNLGIAAYTLFQMGIMAGVFSYSILWVKKRMTQKWVEIIQLLFYGLFPVIPMYAVCSAKDSFFTIALLVVVLQMLTLFENPKTFLAKKGRIIASILAAALMMLFRNNGCYAYLVWIPLALVGVYAAGKKRGADTLVEEEKDSCQRNIIKTAVILFASVALFLLISKGLEWGLNAVKGGSQEMLTVPIQQLVRTWNYSPEVFTEEEKERLFSYIPEEELDTYNPRISDIIKSKFNNEAYRTNPGEFIRLWMRIGLRKPITYLNAWLMTSYGFWYPDAVINVYGGNTVYTYTYEDSSYFGFETEMPGTRESRFPWLEEQYRKISLELYQQKVPGVSMFFSPGFLFWTFAFCLGFLLYMRQWQRLIPMTLILLVWLTFLLGPTYLVRYVLILWFGLPVIVSRVKM